jgi:UDP-N-acetyl-D-mannosaminuronate dehydrogenase
MGEVGTAIYEFLKEKGYDIDSYDVKGEYPDVAGKYDVIHICFPYSESFEDNVLLYIGVTHPSFIIIHSTVPVGTTRRISPFAVHSPVRGTHPNLLKSLKKFTKYFGGLNASWAASIFDGIPIRTFDRPETTEALKLWDTLQYGLMIMIEKEIYRWCQKEGLDYEDVYRRANEEYNKGYEELGRPEVVRPFLKDYPGPIGGHCIISNAKLVDSWLSELLLQKNETYKEEQTPEDS